GDSRPASASEALQRSLNVPFIDLLERYGAEKFVAKLDAGGLKLKVPGKKANLAVILGGAGTSLEKLVTGYSALARGGKSIQLKYLASELAQPIGERHFISKQSAWVAWKTLSEISRPGSLSTYASLKSQQPLAWKTGTSFGFRDTWAIGVSQKYTIGVWIGRPDGTPIPGHSGRQTAGPLLFAVSDHIQREGLAIEQPDNVEQVDICWPVGIRAGLTPDEREHCHVKHKAWVINEMIPATWHGAEADNWQPNPLPYWVNDKTGLRVNAGCEVADKQQKFAPLWPKVVEPWLVRQYQKNNQLPGFDPACKNQIAGADNSLQITGITSGSIYRTASNSAQLPSLSLQAIGGSGQRHWYINGELKYSANHQQVIPHPLSVPGEHQLVVIDDAGNVDKVTVFVEVE
ncbi:MAG: hypothetical protein MJK04_22290, partial [Psychrosphaera sp.]|nr:hypothetical protein [Psychrosphaera sp.]